jgi:hypothetical protein
MKKLSMGFFRRRRAKPIYNSPLVMRLGQQFDFASLGRAVTAVTERIADTSSVAYKAG